MMRPRTWLLSVIATVIASCVVQAPRPTPPAGHAAPSQQLDAMYEEYFEEQLKLNPTLATYLGDERYNDQLENTADEKFVLQNLAVEKRYLERIRHINPASLTGSARISYDIFTRERELAIESGRFPWHLLPIDQMDSMASTIALLGSGTNAQPFRNLKDYENFLGRIQGFVRWSDSAIASMREGMKRGVVQPRVVMVKAVPQLRELAQEDPEKTVFWQVVKNMPAAIAPADHERITALYRDAIRMQLVPAYRRLADFIEKDYLPATRSSVGWSALPDGAAWYKFRILTSTTTTLSADEIHELGLREVARIRAEMQGVKEQVGFAGDLHAFFTYLQTDPKFFFRSSDQVLQAFRDLKQRIDAKLPAMFSDFPKADYEIRAVEQFRAESSPGAFYQAPSPDGKRPGIFYVNTFNLKAQPIYGMETLSLHEAAPGHHFQISIQQELTELPRFRRFNGYNAYAEGWALYCESIGKELGMFTDPFQWYGRLSDEMLRAERLVIDTGLHSKGWTREQAIAYMHDNSAMTDSDIVAEVERYIAWPGQALSYKVGQLRISALRARAQQALGAKFNVKEFHSQLLRDGALPLDVLEAKIDRWIAAAR